MLRRLLRHHLTKSLRLNEIDKKWVAKWSENGKPPRPEGSTPFYCLSMFPYPSGILHLGHLRVYTISDVISRFKRMNGYDVIHPMGWDAFGLPAENAAVERGIDPAVWTETNIAKMKTQMQAMMADFDWDREVSTCSPEYYKWTQKIFTLMFEHGLAYRKHAEINWDPVDQTVLANEQVDAEGRSWRSGAIVEKKQLEQWFIGITKYADQLTNDLKWMQWPDKVKAMQRNWIGQSSGAEIVFRLRNGDEVKVFTTRPDTLFSVQYVALALDHPLVKASTLPEVKEFTAREHEADSKEGVLLDFKVSLPIDVHNNASERYDVPVYAAPYVIGGYGSGAVMGCPAHDERDAEFWQVNGNGVPRPTVRSKKGKPSPLFTKQGVLFESKEGIEDLGEYAGLASHQAAQLVIKALEKHRRGAKSVQLRLRDWLISRQRYWGAPIPIVHCDSCGPVAVPDKDLPVLLPKVERSHFGKGSPLRNLESFVSTTCPSCGSPAKRDTDTMDTFMDSSWYFFRYVDPHNPLAPFDHAKASKHLPVDLYLGGVEHAILHLLYSRFVAKFLGDIGLWDGSAHNNEPIRQLVTQGMVHGKTYKDPKSGRFLKPQEVDLLDPANPRMENGDTPLVSFEKMSKSKYNGADPGECIAKYGADATRAHMLFQAPINDVLNWNEEQIQGIERWLKRVLLLAELKEQHHEGELSPREIEFHNDVAEIVGRVTRSIDKDLAFNTIISDYMKLTNTITQGTKESVHPALLFNAYKTLITIMAPVTPAVSEECWNLIGQRGSVLQQSWPQVTPIESPVTTFNVFVNGKARALFEGLKTLVEQPQADIVAEAAKYVGKFLTTPIKRVIIQKNVISIVTEK